MFKNVPHKKKLFTIPEEKRTCDTCGSVLSAVGEEFVCSEIEYIPAKIKVIDYYKETFECRNCRKNEQPYMKKPEVPCVVIQHSYASASTVSWVIHQKYELAVQLYRQEQEWASMGVSLKRSIMSNWIMAVYRDWLAPVEELLHRKLLEENCLHADETPVQVLNEPGRKNTTQSYMWLYRTGKLSKRLSGLSAYRCVQRIRKSNVCQKMLLLDPSKTEVCRSTSKRTKKCRRTPFGTGNPVHKQAF